MGLPLLSIEGKCFDGAPATDDENLNWSTLQLRRKLTHH